MHPPELLQPPHGLQQPPLPQNTHRHSTFAELYGDATKDPCAGQYAPIMSRFDPMHANAVQGNVLMDQALGASAVPQAYLCCSSSRRGTRIHCVHMPSRFTGSLDGHVTPWDNNLYAFLGEITQSVATIVAFPSTAFNVVENVRAHSADYILQKLDTINGQDVFPPVTPNDGHAVIITSRYLMYLPTRYVPLLLDS